MCWPHCYILDYAAIDTMYVPLPSSHPPMLITSKPRLQSGYYCFPVHEAANQLAFVGLLVKKVPSFSFYMTSITNKSRTHQLLTYGPKQALPMLPMLLFSTPFST